jgi:hypothetical protein
MVSDKKIRQTIPKGSFNSIFEYPTQYIEIMVDIFI